MIKLKSILSETYIPTVSDVDIIAATIVGEAGGEGYKGMQAVKNVLQNRAKKKGTTASGEAVRPKQFSMWNKATDGVIVAADYVPKKIQAIIDIYKSHSNWDSAVTLAAADVKDITGGATKYYASGGTQKINPPYWAKNWIKPIVIGNHTFGN